VLALLLLSVLEGVYMGGITLRRTSVDVPLLLFIAYGVLNALTSLYWAVSRDELFLLCDFVIVYIIGVRILSREKNTLRFSMSVVILSAALSLYSIVALLSSQASTAIRGPFVNQNHFAGWLEMCLPLSLSLAFFSRGERKGYKPLFFFFSILIGLALLLTLSRGGVVSMACALIISSLFMVSTGLLSGRSATILLFPLILLLFGYLTGLDPLVRRFSLGDVGISSAARFSMWSAAGQVFLQHPLMGSGMGTFAWLYPRFRPIEVFNKVEHAHNEYLQILAEMGAVGFLLMAVCAYIFFKSFFKTFSNRHDPEMKGIALGALTGVICLSFHNLMDFNLHVPSNVVLYAAEAALAIVAINTRLRPTQECLVPEKVIPLRGWIRTAVGVLFFSLSIVWAWVLLRPALANHYFSRGTTMADIRRAIEFDGSRAEYRCSLGRAFYRIPAPLLERDDLVRKGVKEMEAGIALNPRDPDCRCDLGWMYFTLGIPERAEEQTRACVELDPNNYYYHQILGNIYLRIGKRDKAIEEVKKVTSIYPQGLMGMLEELYSARFETSELQEIVPKNPESLRQFATFLWSRGKRDEAVGYLEKALAMAPADKTTIKYLVDTYRENNQKEKAMATLRHFLEREPSNGEFHRLLGDLLADVGQYEKAIAEYRQALSRNPSDLAACRNLASLYRKHGEKEKAQAVLSEGTRNNPESGSFFLELAGFYREEGKWIESLQSAKKAALKEPRREDIRAFIATLYIDRGMDYEAITELKEILNVNPGNIGVKLWLGSIYEGIDLFPQARQIYEEILAADPNNQQVKDRLQKLPSTR